MEQPRARIAFLKPILFLLGLFALMRGFDFALVSPLASEARPVLRDLAKHAQSGGVDQLFLGTSRIFCGIDPTVVTEQTSLVSFDLAAREQSMMSSYHLLKSACKTLPHPPKRVLLEVSQRRFCGESVQFADWITYDALPNGANRLDFLLSAVPPKDIPKTIFPSLRSNNRNQLTTLDSATLRQTVAQNIKDKLSADYRAGDPRFASLDYFGNFAKDGYIPTARMIPADMPGGFDPTHWDRADLNPQSLNDCKKIIQFCHKNGIEIVLFSVACPTSFLCGAESLQDYLDFMAEQSAAWNVPFWDFELIRTEKFSGQNEQIKDGRHLSDVGAHDFSLALGEFLQAHDAGSLNLDEWFYPDIQAVLDEKRGIYACLIEETPPGFTCFLMKDTHTKVEFRWSWLSAPDTEPTVLTGWTTKPTLDVRPPPGVLRVEVRGVKKSTLYAYAEAQIW